MEVDFCIFTVFAFSKVTHVKWFPLINQSLNHNSTSADINLQKFDVLVFRLWKKAPQQNVSDITSLCFGKSENHVGIFLNACFLHKTCIMEI